METRVSETTGDDLALDLLVTSDGRLRRAGRALRCAVGRGGIRCNKREGDGATPAGCFPLRRLLYRADRLAAPSTGLPVAALSPRDGWCDDPADALYNRQVTLPCAARHERLWRDDGIYDLVVVVGHNDDPVRPGLGSAIFLHLARSDYAPTEGCVALALDDLRDLLACCGAGDRLCVVDQPA